VSDAFKGAGRDVQYVWVSIGGNDFLSSGCALPADGLEQRVTSVLSTVKSSARPGVRIVTTGYCQVWKPEDPDTTCGKPASISTLQSAIGSATAAVNGTFIDAAEFCGGSATAFSPSTYFRDAVHLNARGYCHLLTQPAIQRAFGCNARRYDCASVRSHTHGLVSDDDMIVALVHAA